MLGFCLYGVIFGLFCVWLAHEKGRDGGSWFILGFIFGIFALLALGLAPSLKARSDTKANPAPKEGETNEPNNATTGVDEQLKECPDCVEMIKLRARKCRYCGKEFSQEDVDDAVAAYQQTLCKINAEAEEALKSREREEKLRHDKKCAESGAGLIDAISQKNANEVARMLALGADPNKVFGAEYSTPKVPIECAVTSGNSDIVKILLEAGAKIPKSILHIAAKDGTAEIVRLLVEHGADITTKVSGKTALDIAEKRAPKPSEIITILKSAPIRVICPKCNRTLSIPQEYRGTTGSCTHCQTKISVPK